MKKLLFAVAIMLGISVASCCDSNGASQCATQNEDTTTCIVDSDSVVVDSLEITE